MYLTSSKADPRRFRNIMTFPLSEENFWRLIYLLMVLSIAFPSNRSSLNSMTQVFLTWHTEQIRHKPFWHIYRVIFIQNYTFHGLNTVLYMKFVAPLYFLKLYSNPKYQISDTFTKSFLMSDVGHLWMFLFRNYVIE